MRLIPEYEPVQKLYLCFVQEFFNTRFGYGKTICQIINAIQPYIDIELLIGPAEMPYFQKECSRYHTSLEKVKLNHDTPGRSILAEYTPIFAENEKGEGNGLIFQTPCLDNAAELKRFSERFTARLGFQLLDTGFDFATAHLWANEDVVLLSEGSFKGEDQEAKLRFFADHFPEQSFHVVPPLAGDVTNDLDMVLWPIAPKVWIVSEYPSHTPQAASIEPALQVLQEYQHTVHRVPGLEPIVYDDINTMPNYANGVIINQVALVPAYQRKEDEVIVGILKNYGYQVLPIDCSNVILTNCGIHCISKTVPAISAIKLSA
jgi:hypothetical protein